MARYTKDFKKELRQIGGKFKWIELSASEQGIAREKARIRTVESGGRGTPKTVSAPGGSSADLGGKPKNGDRWFTRKTETASAAPVESGGRGTPGGSETPAQAPGGQSAPGGQGERKERRDAPPSGQILLGGRVNFNVDQLADQLVGGHEILALVLRNPVWRINQDQGKNLARAIDDLARLHNIPIDPKKLALLQLGAVGVAIYGPKIFQVAMTPKKAAPPKPPENAPVQPGGIDVLNATMNYGGHRKH